MMVAIGNAQVVGMARVYLSSAGSFEHADFLSPLSDDSQLGGVREP